MSAPANTAALTAATAEPGPIRIRHIAYCRVCNRQISAETAAENGGNCNAHAHQAVGVRWQASDDYRP